MQSGFVFEESQFAARWTNALEEANKRWRLQGCALERNVSANSFAFSSGSMAQEPSGRCNAGMFSVQPALVRSVFAIFHQRLNPAPKVLAMPFMLGISQYDAYNVICLECLWRVFVLSEICHKCISIRVPIYL